jgi:hypothetical protein
MPPQKINKFIKDLAKKVAEKELGVGLHRVQQIALASGVVVKVRFWLVSGDFTQWIEKAGDREWTWYKKLRKCSAG